jgi:hypothetical protein
MRTLRAAQLPVRIEFLAVQACLVWQPRGMDGGTPCLPIAATRLRGPLGRTIYGAISEMALPFSLRCSGQPSIRALRLPI